MNENTLPDFDQIYMTREGSIGEYVYGDCPTCAASDDPCEHTILICRVCGAPPLASGCVCDARFRNLKAKQINLQETR